MIYIIRLCLGQLGTEDLTFKRQRLFKTILYIQCTIIIHHILVNVIYVTVYALVAVILSSIVSIARKALDDVHQCELFLLNMMLFIFIIGSSVVEIMCDFECANLCIQRYIC